MSRRRSWSRGLTVIGLALLLVALVVGYARDVIADSDEFADRAEVAFTDPAVRATITEQVVDQLLDAEPELLAVQPLLISIVDGALGSDTAAGIFRAAVADVHRTLFTDGVDTVTLQLADLILVAKTQLTVIDPELGALIPDELTDAIIAMPTSDPVVAITQLAETLEWLSVIAAIAGIVTLLAAVWVADQPRRVMVGIGLGLVIIAALAIVLEQLARWWVAAGDDVAIAIWDAFLDDLSTWALVVAATGAVLAAIAWFGLRPADARAHLDRALTRLAPPQGRWGRIAWGAGAAVLGLVLVLRWELALRFTVSAVGAVLVAVGAREALLAAFPGLVRREASDRPAPASEGEGRGARVLATIALVGLGVVMVTVLVIGGDDGDEAAAEADPACNGSVVLCERPLTDVALAATHNSHAAARDGFSFGYQTVGIGPQLEDGIRALLIDVYFGLDTGEDLVVTDRAPITADEREVLVAEMGEAAVRSAEATAARQAETGGTRDLYLCHAFCEIGARLFVDELRVIADFLDDHPREVVVMIIQDEGPQPADVAEAFAQSGLDRFVYTHDPDEPWPTLGAMIEADERVVVMAENVSGGVDWYHDAFTLTQDTPFTFDTVDDFTCVLNRGEADSPLLLVNHWIRPVSPGAADEANQREVLLDRVEQCGRERDLDPNLIAVDFHDRGDLVDVVRELNGL